MSLEERLLRTLEKNKVQFVITVPCKFFASLLERLKSETSIKIISPAREEEGLGIAAGCYLGGARSVLLIQNSGLGNMVNAVKSLNEYYGIPFFAIVSQRGGRDEKIDAQKPMGRFTPRLLRGLGVRYQVLQSPGQVDIVDKALRESFAKSESNVVLLKQSFWK